MKSGDYVSNRVTSRRFLTAGRLSIGMACRMQPAVSGVGYSQESSLDSKSPSAPVSTHRVRNTILCWLGDRKEIPILRDSCRCQRLLGPLESFRNLQPGLGSRACAHVLR